MRIAVGLVVVAVYLAVVGVAGEAAAQSLQFCVNKPGTKAQIRNRCKGKETAVDPGTLGLTGAKGDQGDQGVQGLQGLQGVPGPGAMWAVVSEAGAILAQSGGITITPRAPGVTELAFGADLSGKVIQASAACIASNCVPRGVILTGLCGTAPQGIGGPLCLAGTIDNQHVVVITTGADNSTAAPLAYWIAAF